MNQLKSGRSVYRVTIELLDADRAAVWQRVNKSSLQEEQGGIHIIDITRRRGRNRRGPFAVVYQGTVLSSPYESVKAANVFIRGHRKIYGSKLKDFVVAQTKQWLSEL